MGKHTDSVDANILMRLQSHGQGWVFTPADFADLGSRTAVATALKRQKAAGTIRLLGRGLYDIPIVHPVLGLLWPAIETVAKALERKEGIRLQPSGVYAANLLGLSEQVPAKVVFLSDGATRSVKVGPTQISLTRTTPRNMAAAGRLSGLLIQAFRSLGAANITPQRIAHLRESLPDVERAKLLHDIALAPEWMHAHLREVAKP
ncbi:MAG: DUF6088 family protein [Rhodoferax sp.]|uniref:DUF6088 family protein n=1 Tax=Rhodoferax sp. TaxID=50421 RepID=UPI002616F405|nr:DUF6088 family protein [Rhodoferax sp.]MDD2878989.1 DUF6088 family protein [Rhodoferax sp.]